MSDDGELLDLILSATVDGMMDWRIPTDELQYTPRWKLMLGFDTSELDDGPDLWQRLTHPEDLPRVEASLRDHLENAWPFDELFRMRHREGGWRWIQARGFSSRDQLGGAKRLVVWFSDVNDRVLVERENRVLAAALQAAGEGICGLDLEGRITFANPATCTILNRPAGELIGQNAHELVHPPSGPSPHDAQSCPVLAPLRGASESRVAADVFARQDGAGLPVSYVATPIRAPDGSNEVTGAVVSVRDMTRQRELEAQLVQAQKLEAIGQLAAGIAHEINTPLQYVGDNAAFLETAFDDLLRLISQVEAAMVEEAPPAVAATLAARVEAIHTAGDLDYLRSTVPTAVASVTTGIQAMSTIVKAMKAFSHPGSAEKTLADVNSALRNTVTITRHEWKLVADVRLDLDETLPQLRCHPGELNQVFSNLIVNAAQAIEEANRDVPGAKGHIDVRTRRDSEALEIRISDDGPGIPETVRHRIFDPFFTTKPVGKGTGQGLSIARSIVVNRHGGTLTVESQVGAGTTFLIRLPLAPVNGCAESPQPFAAISGT